MRSKKWRGRSNKLGWLWRCGYSCSTFELINQQFFYYGSGSLLSARPEFLNVISVIITTGMPVPYQVPLELLVLPGTSSSTCWLPGRLILPTPGTRYHDASREKGETESQQLPRCRVLT